MGKSSSTSIHKTLFSLKLMNEQNKLECYTTLNGKGLLGKKRSSLLGSFQSYKENEA
jgi:hypothetical protein